jgi:hypothetical protein
MSAEYSLVEINEAVRAAGQVAFAFEDEYHPFTWESRLELAAVMRDIAAESDGRTRQLAERVEFILESEIADLGEWEERFAAANLCRAVAEGLRREGAR